MPRSGVSYQRGSGNNDNYDNRDDSGLYRRDEVKQDSGTPAERVLYHVIMMLVRYKTTIYRFVYIVI